MNFAALFLLPQLLADLPLPLLGGLVFVWGAFVGSFLNVVIHRLPLEDPSERDIVFKPSHCPACHQPIKPYDNIPILSYLILRGRCRACKIGISPRYVAVEALTGLMWLLVLLHHIGTRGDLTWVFLCDIVLVTALVALVFIDAAHQWLPNVITYPCLVFALAARVALAWLYGPGAFEDVAWLMQREALAAWHPVAVSLLGAVLGALAGGGTLFLIGFVWEKLQGLGPEEAMGYGDVKMMLAVGAYLGWRMTFLTLLLGAVSGSLIGIGLMAWRGQRDLKMKLPFGIFLGLGSVLSLLVGLPVLHWYLSYFQ